MTSETYESIFGHLVGLRGRGISPSQATTYTQDSTTQKNADLHTSVPRAGFEATIPVFERSKSGLVLFKDILWLYMSTLTYNLLSEVHES